MRGALFRFAPLLDASSSVTLTSTPSSGGSLLTVGRKGNLNIPAPLARAAGVKTNGFFSRRRRSREAQPSRDRSVIKSPIVAGRPSVLEARPAAMAPRVNGFRDADGRLSMNAHQWLGIGAYASLVLGLSLIHI